MNGADPEQTREIARRRANSGGGVCISRRLAGRQGGHGTGFHSDSGSGRQWLGAEAREQQPPRPVITVVRLRLTTQRVPGAPGCGKRDAVVRVVRCVFEILEEIYACAKGGRGSGSGRRV
eukprot:852332-Prymnesium_polylepis.2